MSSELDFANPAVQQKPNPAVPRFYSEPEHMGAKSRDAGRPIYEDREYVEIIIPGDNKTRVVEVVNDEHRTRWSEQYQAFRKGLDQPRHGTPLRNWPNSMLTPARVQELAYFNVVTVEELAAVTDGHLQNLGMGAFQMRAAAKLFLETAKNGTGPLERMVAENISLRDEVGRLTRDIAERDAVIADLRGARNAHA